MCFVGRVRLQCLQKIDYSGEEHISNRCFTRTLAQVGDVAEQSLDELGLLPRKLLLVECFRSVEFPRVRM